jgi:uncharacterized protein with PQ loop repeat
MKLIQQFKKNFASYDPKRKKVEAMGYLGLILFHTATLPTTITVLAGKSTALPPFSMMALIVSGLVLLLIRAIFIRDTLNIISNSLEIILNGLLLIIIIYKVLL